jgi:hypothetical protein
MVRSVTILLLTTAAKCQLNHRAHQLALAPIALQKPVSSSKVTVAGSFEERRDPNLNSTDAQRAPRQGSFNLFGRLFRAALYAFSSAFGVCAAGLSAFC